MRLVSAALDFPEQLATPEDKLMPRLSEDETTVINDDGTTCPVIHYDDPTVPPIVQTPAGPRSLYDVIHNAPAGKRLVPKSGIENVYQQGLEPGQYEALTPAAVHKKVQAVVRRGRKTSLTIDQAARIKRAYFKGGRTIRQIAEEADLSEPTVSAVVNGRRLWYA